MHLIDKYGYPYERRIGRPIHNFIRACVLIARGYLWFKRGKYEPCEPPVFDADSEVGCAGE